MTYVSELKHFLQHWDDPFIEVAEGEEFAVGALGNINTAGNAQCADSPIFTKYHRYLKRSLELGVRDLVTAFILKYNLITYSSCQGHPATAESEMRCRYIAFIPKDEVDYQRVDEILQYFMHAVNAEFSTHPVQIAMGKDDVESEEITMPALTFFFVPISDNISETVYFQEVEPIYRRTVDLINAVT
ncbi:MAG: hypothetical protein ACRDB1_04060 [Microcoleaceae cyanobacterium]